MSWTFDSGINVPTSAMKITNDGLRVQLSKEALSPKSESRAMKSFYLSGGELGRMPVLRATADKVPNIYADTGISKQFQLPVITGRKAKLDLFSTGLYSNASTSDLGYMTPCHVSIEVTVPDYAVMSTEELNTNIASQLQIMLASLGWISYNGSNILPNFAGLIAGSKDLQENIAVKLA